MKKSTSKYSLGAALSEEMIRRNVAADFIPSGTIVVRKIVGGEFIGQ